MASKTVYCGNLPADVRRSEVEDLFAKYGKIRSGHLSIRPLLTRLSSHGACSRSVVSPECPALEGAKTLATCPCHLSHPMPLFSRHL